MEQFSFKDLVLSLLAIMGAVYIGVLIASVLKPEAQGILNTDITSSMINVENNVEKEEGDISMEPVHGYDDVGELIDTNPYPRKESITCFWYRNKLENEEKLALYDAIEAGILGLRPMIAVDSQMSEDEVSDVFWAVIYDHPEFFWVSKAYGFYEDNDQNVTYFKMRFHEQDKGEIEEKLRRYSSMADAIIGGTLSRYGGDRSLRGIYDWILANTEYQGNDRDQDMTSVFDMHESVCAGYVQAMQFVALRAGIPCVRISGQGVTSHLEGKDTSHTWLAAVTYGNLAYYDPTWGDQNSNPYVYYAMTQHTLEKTHVFTSDKAPHCDYKNIRDDTFTVIDQCVCSDGSHLSYGESYM